MRLVLTLFLAAVLVACADEPGTQGGFSSHYFKNQGAIEEAKASQEPAQAPPAESKPSQPAMQQPDQVSRKADTADDEEDDTLYEQQTGFSSHYHRRALTAEQWSRLLEERVLTLVMNERRHIDPNARALTLDPELTDAARQHSVDMAKNNYVAHANAAGESTSTHIMDTDAKFRGILGENIATQNYDDTSQLDVDEYAERLVDSWLNSETHKGNIAYAIYDRAGVGAAINSHTVYVTLLLASDLGLPEPNLSPSGKAPATGAQSVQP